MILILNGGTVAAMGVDHHALASARLEEAGQRYTAGRSALVTALRDAGRPLTSAELSSAGIPQSTAYRNLTVLEHAGVVVRVHGADERSRFELAEDLAGHHHHLVCRACGSVEDFVPSPKVERTLERLAREAVAGGPFRIDSHRLDLVGVCGRCAA